tara:strand:- start:10 stop:1506 length:1497 start_codon:yes stop_codon:yes gene_type:complete
MAIYTLTPAQLRGAGIYNSFEIPAGGIPSFASTNSFQFDGITDYFLGVGNYNELNGVSIATFSFWIKPQDNALRILLHVPINNTNANGQFFIYQRSGRIQMNIDTASYYCRTPDNTLILNQWNHVMICMNLPSTDEGKIFINGVDQTSIENWYNRTALSTSTGGLYIGESNNGYLAPFYGNMDEVAIWSGSDQRANVSEIYNGGLPNDLNNLPTAPQPTTWQRMGENATWSGFAWTMYDVNGNYRHRGAGIPEEGRTTDVPLFDNKSFTYDGSLDYVNLGDNNNLSFGDGSTDSPFSISAWIKMTDTSGFRILNKYVGSVLEYSFGTGGAGNLQLYLFNSTSGFINRARVQGSILNTGQWYHVVATYSGVGGTNAQNGIKIYVDGVRVDDTTISSGTYVAMGNTTSDAHIGRLNTSYTDGTINDTSLFNTELTQAQVTEIYNGGIANDISSLNPLGYWRSEFANWDGSNWTMIDQGSGANNGTSVSMPLTSRTSDVPT